MKVAGDPRPLDVPGGEQRAGQTLYLAVTCLQLSLALEDGVLGLLALSDVDGGAEVPEIAAIWPVPWPAETDRPPVCTVRPAETKFHVERHPCLDRRHVDAHAGFAVVRMDDVQPSFIQQPLKRQSGELRARVIEVVEGRVRPA